MARLSRVAADRTGFISRALRAGRATFSHNARSARHHSSEKGCARGDCLTSLELAQQSVRRVRVGQVSGRAQPGFSRVHLRGTWEGSWVLGSSG